MPENGKRQRIGHAFALRRGLEYQSDDATDERWDGRLENAESADHTRADFWPARESNPNADADAANKATTEGFVDRSRDQAAIGRVDPPLYPSLSTGGQYPLEQV